MVLAPLRLSPLSPVRPAAGPPAAPPSASFSVLDWLIQKTSYLGFIAFLALCGLGLPIPEEVALVTAGVFSSNGTLDHPTMAFAACLIGALLGDSIMYAIGRRLGHGYLMKHPRFAWLIDPEREEKFEQIVQRHGFKLLLFTRFLVGVRGPVYFAAGAARVPYWRFLLWDGVAATMVVSIVFGLGYFYGAEITRWVRTFELGATLVVLVVVLALAAVLYTRFHRRLRAALENLADDVDTEQPATGEREPLTPRPRNARPDTLGHGVGSPASGSQDDAPAIAPLERGPSNRPEAAQGEASRTA